MCTAREWRSYHMVAPWLTQMDYQCLLSCHERREKIIKKIEKDKNEKQLEEKGEENTSLITSVPSASSMGNDEDVASFLLPNSSSCSIHHKMCTFYETFSIENPNMRLIFYPRKYWQYHSTCLLAEPGKCHLWQSMGGIFMYFCGHALLQMMLVLLLDSLQKILSSPLMKKFWLLQCNRVILNFCITLYHTCWCVLIHVLGPERK